MSSVKIRLVKCPNCWNVLPESVDVPIYKCGGCGKILQAKYRQQQEEDAEKSSDMQGGEDVGDKASGSSKSEEEELNMMPHGANNNNNNGVSDVAGGDQNCHVSFVEDEEEEINGRILKNKESEEAPPSPSPSPSPQIIYLKRIMSGSTEYHDPCSTFSNSPPATQTIRSYNYDASVSSLDDNTPDSWLLSSSSTSNQKPLLLPVKPQPQPRSCVFLGDIESGNGTSPYLVDKTLPPRPPPRYQSFENNFQRYNKPAASPEEYIDEEKIKLLKIVYELEEQLLKKTCTFQGGGVKNTSRSHDLRHPPHWRRRNDMVISSRIIPFSGDGRFALPRNRQLHSEPLPPPPYKKNMYRRRTRTGVINSYSSWPSTPVDELLSPWQQQQQQQLDRFQMKMMQTSNLNKKKQHLRPIARAAPFIACHNCSEFLQLPEDFLLFKGRYHRVRCGGCSFVMSFSLENATYLVPYYQQEEDDDDDLDFRAPPPSEADESSSIKMKIKMRRSSSSTSSSRGKMTYSHSTGAPLHNLMGYSTVSRVFKGYGPSSATSSMLNR